MTAAPPVSSAVMATGGPRLTEAQWLDYRRDGYLLLGELLSAEEVIALQDRADQLALGSVVNPAVELQLDTGGRYEDLPEATRETPGTLLYRKIQGLETDDLYRSVLEHPIFTEIAASHYGRHAPVSLFRAMVMNKPAGQGTILPWHQDGGDVWALDRDPLITVWVALDAATRENGCVEVIPGSHRLGLLSRSGSTVGDDDAARHCPPDQVTPLEVPAGHALLMHNWLIHRSGVNPTPQPRRAFTACYMDGRTRNLLTGAHFPMIIGEAPPANDHFVAYSKSELEHQRQTAAAAQEYALSLQSANAAIEVSLAEATRYVHSLEAEVSRLSTQLATGQPSELSAALASRIEVQLRRAWSHVPTVLRRQVHVIAQSLRGERRAR